MNLKSLFREKLLIPIVFFVILVVAGTPMYFQSKYLARVMTLSCIWAVICASFDILSGYTPCLSYGHAVFFGVGAYTQALLSYHRYIWGVAGEAVDVEAGLIEGYYIHPIICLFLAGLVAVAISIPFGFLSMRIRGAFFSIATLAFGEILYSMTEIYFWIFGAEEGVRGIWKLIPWTIPNGVLYNYYLAAFFCVAFVTILYFIGKSRIGLTLRAIKEDELVAEMSGVNTLRYKVLAFAISAFVAGFIGGFQATYTGYVGREQFMLITSAKAMMSSVVGGMGTILGPAGGGFILTLVAEALRISDEFMVLTFVLIFIPVLLFTPGGLITGLIIPRIKALFRRGSSKE